MHVKQQKDSLSKFVFSDIMTLMKRNEIKHVAIIMDGNRRWAKQRDLEVKAGHKEGVEALERIVKSAVKSGVKYLTVYALSTENLKERQKSEIGDLFSLIKTGFLTKLPILKKEGVRVKFLGDVDTLPLVVKQTLLQAEKRLSDGKRLQLNIALNYGAQAEIIQAVKQLKPNEKINEESFSKYLYTKDIPDPELLIRTGGQKRLSNFLLWQAAYSELYFTDKLWPDFGEEDFKQALADFAQRKRNFGS